jgi:thiamine kinase-like enzyme
MTESPQAVLARIPGWERAECSRLHGGLTNRSWIVSVNGRRAVLKIDAAPRGAPYNDRLAEKSIQTIAARAGLANSVLYADECVYLTEYVEGSVWKKSCLDKDENLESLAISLRKLHLLPLTRRSFDAVDAAQRYSGKIDVGKPDIAEHCLNIVKKMHAPHNLCCCHNDLVAGNIITVPELRFLDWEYACDNDPFFDLATVVAHHDLTAKRSNIFLDYYFDGDGDRWSEKLERQMTLYNALVWLWYASRPEPDPQALLAFESRLS